MLTKVDKKNDKGKQLSMSLDNEGNDYKHDSVKGLSIPSNLVADLKITKRKNNECQVLVHERKAFKKTGNRKGKKGDRLQKGLTRRGKTNLRIASDCYELLVTDSDFYDKHELVENKYNSYCRFITLTFRNIIPSDKDAKKLLDSFLQRFRRKRKHSIHYCWVAERQKRGAIHFHILTPEKIYDDTNNCDALTIRMEENLWINKSWNEVVCNWARKNNIITKTEFDEWKNEYNLSSGYYKSLVNFWSGKRTTKPRKPKKSKYLLLPNCSHVLKAGNYMGKYMSKENENIVGGMYALSKATHGFMGKTEVVSKGIDTIFYGNQIVNYIYHSLKKNGKKPMIHDLKHNDCRLLWACKYDYELVLQYYFEFIEKVNLGIIIPNKIQSKI